MGLILNKYDGDNRLDHCFFDSSNVVYAVCNDKLDDLKDLTVVFKDGRTYLYEQIPVSTYLLWRQSVSQGKDLFKYIVVKDKGVDRYKTTRIQDTDLKMMESKKQEILLEREIKRKELLKEQENVEGSN